MKIMVLAFLLTASSSAVFAQTTAEDFQKAGDLKSWKAYGKDATPEAADAAIVDYDSAIRLKVDYHEAYNGRANMKLQKGELDGALSDYSKAIEFGPTVGSYYSNRAKLREKMADIKGALADSSKAISLAKGKSPSYLSLVYLSRGEIRLNNKDYAGAIVDLDKSLEVKPDYYAARGLRAKAYRALGKNTLADADEKIYEDEGRKFEEKLFGK